MADQVFIPPRHSLLVDPAPRIGFFTPMATYFAALNRSALASFLRPPLFSLRRTKRVGVATAYVRRADRTCEFFFIFFYPAFLLL